MVLGATWLLVLVSAVLGTLVMWSGKDPATYERYFAAPFRRGRWWLWAHGSWSRLAKRCGLSDSEQVTRRDSEGKHTTARVWTHPKLLRVKTSDHCLYLTVRTRTGQTVDHFENAVPAIRDAAGAHSARSMVVAPGTVRMEFVMREQLAGVDHASIPAHVATPVCGWGGARTARRGSCGSLDGTHSRWDAQGPARARCSGESPADSAQRSSRAGPPGRNRPEVRHRSVSRIPAIHESRHDRGRRGENPCRPGRTNG